MEWLNDVRAIFAEYGVPEYVWRPIAFLESSLNPRAHNPRNEDSRGLFQINIQANPRYAGYDLFDPLVNARIAARDFIAPAYNRAIARTQNPLEVTEYVWRSGIRPRWTENHTAKIHRETQKVLDEVIELPVTAPTEIRIRPQENNMPNAVVPVVIDTVVEDEQVRERGLVERITGIDFIGGMAMGIAYIGLFLLIGIAIYIVFIKENLPKILPGKDNDNG